MLIKHIPEDFVVEEITNVKAKKKGRYCYFWLEKKNKNTQDAVEEAARALRVKKIGFAGAKDKKAITRQLCSAENVRKEMIERVKLSGIKLIFYGYGDEPISLGDLDGNAFQIVVRDVDADIKVKKINSIVNYFDEQRFSENNVEIGKAIVKKNFKKAVELIAHGEGRYNVHVKEFNAKSKTNFIGALRLIPLKTLKLFVHSYQSWLWNETVEQLIEKSVRFKRVAYSQGQLAFPLGQMKNRKVSIVGFDTDVKDKVKHIIDELMKRENIVFRDFIIREIPELSSEGTEREMIAAVKKFSFRVEDDELFSGRKKISLNFSLPKGSYATMVVKMLFS